MTPAEAPPLSDEQKAHYELLTQTQHQRDFLSLPDAQLTWSSARILVRGSIVRAEAITALLATIAAKQREVEVARKIAAARDEQLYTERDAALAKLEAVTADNAALVQVCADLRAARLSYKDSIHEELEAVSRILKQPHPGAALLARIAELEARQLPAGCVAVCDRYQAGLRCGATKGQAFDNCQHADCPIVKAAQTQATVSATKEPQP